MEFHVRLPATDVDVSTIEAGLMDIDPAALADLDARGMLRVATSADEHQIARVLADAGHPVALREVVRQPSVCCGSCSG